MRYKTQKIIFYAIAAIIVSFLFTCRPFGTGDDDVSDGDRFTYTDVEYSPDGRSLTIYLDGSKPIRQSRSLNLELAKSGHDLFEVAFMYYDGSQYTIARASWETGHAAGVSGVARNVNYASADPTGLTTGVGAAIVFVGKKSDRTLLGVGRLTSTDDPANGGPTFVSANTRSVTFYVAALTAGTGFTGSESSFWTAALDDPSFTDASATNTEIAPVMIGNYLFPLYWLNKTATVNQNIYAEYKFETFSTVQNPTNINDYSNGILQAGPASLAMLSPPNYRLVPRYPLGDGQWESSSLALLQDSSTVVQIRNNPSGSPVGTSPFRNPIEFQINTVPGNNGKIFAFSFQLPVYPLANNDGRGSGNLWYIRPGYDSFLYDLDDGKADGKEGGTGGAILIGTGNVVQSLSYNLWVRPPAKTIYPEGADDYTFDLDRIIVNLRVGNNESFVTKKTILSVPPDVSVTDSNLKFYLGTNGNRQQITMGQNIKQYLFLPSPPNDPDPLYVSDTGNIDITVEYFDPETQEPGETPYSTMFTVYLFTGGGIPDSSNIADNHRFIIGSEDDLVKFGNFISNPGGGPGNYLLVFFDSYDLPLITMSSGEYFFIIIAAKPGVVVGKQTPTPTAPTDLFAVNAPNCVFYLGMWPFNDTLTVRGLAITSHPLTVNAGGRHNNLAGAADGGYFINNGTNPGARSVDVIKGPGFVAVHENYLIRTP